MSDLKKCLILLVFLSALGCKERSGGEASTGGADQGASDLASVADEGGEALPEYGARTQQQLITAAMTALAESDMADYKRLMAPSEQIIAECPEAFAGETAKKLFERRYLHMEESLKRGMAGCAWLFGGEFEELGRQGGERFEVPPGCAEGVKRYESVEVYVRVRGKVIKVTLPNPVSMSGGERWVLDREPSCVEDPEPMSGERVGARVAEWLLEDTAEMRQSLVSVALPVAYLRAACPSLEGEVFERRLGLVERLDRTSRHKACREHVGGKEVLAREGVRERLTIEREGELERVEGCDETVWRGRYVMRFEGAPRGGEVRLELIEHRGAYKTTSYLAALPSCE